MKPVPGLVGITASSEGQIFKDGILLISYGDKGYPRVNIKTDRHRSYRVNRLVCMAYHGPPPQANSQARHLDGSRTNNRPENLAWGSAWDNMQDSIRHGAVNHKLTGRKNALFYVKRGQGVSYSKSKDSWAAYIYVNKRAIILGTYKDERMARAARAAAVRLYEKAVWPLLQEQLKNFEKERP